MLLRKFPDGYDERDRRRDRSCAEAKGIEGNKWARWKSEDKLDARETLSKMESRAGAASDARRGRFEKSDLGLSSSNVDLQSEWFRV